MRIITTWILGTLLAVITAASDTVAQNAPDKVPEHYVGRWRGVSGKASTNMSQQKGLATVTKDFGHTIDEFSFEVAADGTVTGEGSATYWFNVTSDADLVIRQVKKTAYIAGGQQKVRFKIEGKMSADGKLRLRSVTKSKLILMNAGSLQTIDAWNVFGPYENKVAKKDERLQVEAVHKVPKINMLLWQAEKPDCEKLKEEIEFLEDHYLPSVDFIIAKYNEARTNANIWKKKSFEQIQDWVLGEVRKKYPKTKTSSRTWQDKTGKVVTKIADCGAPFPFVCELTPKHVAWHVQHHISQDDAARNSLSDDDYIKWLIGNEIDAYQNVNKKLTEEHLADLKKECREWCEARCCGR